MQIFNIAEETLAMHNDIIQNAIENNGIIFGGAVRNKIIRDHHNYKFNEYINDNSFNAKGLIDYKSDYWNKDIHSESKARTIISNDIDIYFKDKYDYEHFRDFLRLKRFTVKHEKLMNDSYVNLPEVIEHYKLVFTFEIGGSYTKKGELIKINIDVVFPKEPYLHLEPPFSKTDFLCNAFVQDKSGIRISNNTGTPIDNMTFAQKALVSSRIILNMIKFKTLMNMSITGNLNVLLHRVSKMVNDENYKWNITNLPLRVVHCNSPLLLHKECCICQESFNPDDKIIGIRTSNNKIIGYHDYCFIKYLKFLVENSGSDEMLCPMRNDVNLIDNTIDFKQLCGFV